MKKYYVLQIGSEYPADDAFAAGFDRDAVLRAAQEFAQNEAYDGHEIRIADVDYATDNDAGTEQGYVNSVEIIRSGSR